MRYLRSAFAFAALMVALCFFMRASHAYQTGDSRWCAVTNKVDSLQWDCEYDTSEECAAAIAGTGGYGAINPLWRPDPSSGRFSGPKQPEPQATSAGQFLSGAAYATFRLK